MICDVNGYYEYISINYDNLKDKIKRILFLEHIKFDEDIFHTTLYNCYNLLVNKNLSFLSESNLESYLYSAMKLNIFRNKKYASNKYKFLDINDDNNIIDYELSYMCDFHIITDILKNEFGDKLLNAYYCNINGESISSLQNELNIKNLKSKLKKIKKYINDKNRESFI